MSKIKEINLKLKSLYGTFRKYQHVVVSSFNSLLLLLWFVHVNLNDKKCNFMLSTFPVSNYLQLWLLGVVLMAGLLSAASPQTGAQECTDGTVNHTLAINYD